METRLEAYAHVLINAGQRGVMVKLTSANLIRVLNAVVTDLIHG